LDANQHPATETKSGSVVSRVSLKTTGGCKLDAPSGFLSLMADFATQHDLTQRAGGCFGQSEYRPCAMAQERPAILPSNKAIAKIARQMNLR